MARYFLLTALSFFFAANTLAQDDDMYFTPKKGSASAATRHIRESEVTEAYDYQQGYDADANTVYHSGSIRDVDEYNRRYRASDTYTSNDGNDVIGQDSVLVSREDYENSMKMKRFDGYNNVTLIVNDPWYYDPWYYDPFYWHSRWYDPWYYSYYDPWHYGHGWYGYWGGYHSWGFGYTWHSHPVHRPIWSGGRPVYHGSRPSVPARRYYSNGRYNSGRWATADKAQNRLRGTSGTSTRNYSTNSTRRYTNSGSPSNRTSSTTTRNRQNTNSSSRSYTTTPSANRSYNSSSNRSSYSSGSPRSYSSGSSIGGGGSRSYGGGGGSTGGRGGRR